MKYSRAIPTALLLLLLPAIIHAQAGAEPGSVPSDDESAEYCECELVAPKSVSGICLDFGGVVEGEDGLAYCTTRSCVMKPALKCMENGKEICLITRVEREKLKFFEIQDTTGKSMCTLDPYNATVRTVVGPNPNYIPGFEEPPSEPGESPSDEPIPEPPLEEETVTPTAPKKNCTCGFVAPREETGVCLDFVSLIPGDDTYVYCKTRTCTLNPSLRCISSGSEICEVTEGPMKDVMVFDHVDDGTGKSMCTYEVKPSKTLKIIAQ
mmetsp:Transcript_14854/g.37906  ORF Transcript_14854/g.37906 Transcript_14854/m.37906 type:complete len:266 (-) Transcript_14854:61-858(-)